MVYPALPVAATKIPLLVGAAPKVPLSAAVDDIEKFKLLRLKLAGAIPQFTSKPNFTLSAVKPLTLYVLVGLTSPLFGIVFPTAVVAESSKPPTVLTA